MFKSIISSIIAVSVLATPVVAEAKGRGEHRTERHERKRGNHINTGEAIAIGLGAFILGAAIKNNNSRDEEEVEREVYDREYEYHYRRQNCREIFTSGIDRYGDYYEKRITRCN